MVSVGDRIRLALNKGANREGVVTGVTGSMLRVRWSSGEETSLIPAPGTLTVLGRTRTVSRPSKKVTGGAKKATTTKKAASQKRAPSSKRAAGNRSGTARRPSR
jgi:hypothetical protein